MNPTLVKISLALLASSSMASSSLAAEETFSEDLLLRPVASGDVVAHFAFTTRSPPGGSGAREDFRLFPRAMGELMEAHGVTEMDLSLTRGVWRDKRWGRSPNPSPPGAKVSAWFDPHLTSAEVDAAWTGLTNALAGQLCASLNFLYSTQTVSPKFGFQPDGVTPPFAVPSNASSHLKVGFLPGENVCTENLSPWKKLLPCQSKRGLSALLSAKNLHHSRYHSLGLSLRHVCPNGELRCDDPSLELVQSVTLVVAPAINKENESKAPVAWSVRGIFGIGLLATCPLATTSKILLEGAPLISSLKAEPAGLAKKADDGRSLEFSVEELVHGGSNNLQVSYERGEPGKKGVLRLPEVSATRYQVGYGQERGEVVARLENRLDRAVGVVYMDVLPWYLRVYFHTLTVREEGTGKELQPLKTSFVPGVDRERPYSMELVLRLPPKGAVTVSLQFEKSILKWSEYPPDANHGFYVAPAVITHPCLGDDCAEGGGGGGHSARRVYTETLLLSLPTPDFSMPYNVICLACTVVALAFGPLHNITTKVLTLEKEPPAEEQQGLVKRILHKVLTKLRLKKSVEKAEPKEEENKPSEGSDEREQGDGFEEKGQGENGEDCEEENKAPSKRRRKLHKE